MRRLFSFLAAHSPQTERPDPGVRRLHRSRWAAVGAALAVTIGSGGILTTSASIGSGERGVYVPIAPCRLFDTRPAPDNVGTRNTPLGPGDTFTATVRGTNGNCTIPTDAVGLTMNVAIVNPTSSSFLTVFPADVARPLAANANWTAGQPPLSNAVTADISADGRISFYNLAGNVDVAADIVGYYIDHTHDDRYYTKTETDTRYYTKTDSDARYPTKAETNALAIRGGSRVALDTTGNVGANASIAIGTDGLPIIAYHDGTNNDLKVAKCTTTNCTGTRTITAVDTVGNVGYFTSIAIGADGNPVISYLDLTNNDLKVAKCTNPACTGTPTITTIDAPGLVGYYTGLAIGADGNPIISYYDSSNLNLKAAKCTNPACTGTPTITTIDAPGDVGSYTSLTIGTGGLPIISYYDNTNGDLKVAACTNASCTGAATITTIDAPGNVGAFSSIDIAADGNPIMSYLDGTNVDLKAAKCTNPNCTGTATITTLDTLGDVGDYSSLTIGAGGLPIISYLDITTGDLKVAACGTIDCTGVASLVAVESTGSVGNYSTIATGTDGLPIIAHQDATNVDLRIAKCATTTCVP